MALPLRYPAWAPFIIFTFSFAGAATGELLRLRDESLTVCAAAARGIQDSRNILRDAGGTAAERRASELPVPPNNTASIEGAGETVADDASASLAAAGRLAVERSPGSQEWVEEVCQSSWRFLFA